MMRSLDLSRANSRTALCSCVFFFNDTATTEIYTLSLHDALPICGVGDEVVGRPDGHLGQSGGQLDRKSTRLNSSHGYISYAVFCLKKNQERDHRGPPQWADHSETYSATTLAPG